LTAAGFTSSGIAAGSIAAGSSFATLQVLGATGVIAGLGIAGGLVSGLLGYGLYKLFSGSNENK